jgi:hypothetical protein
VYRLSFCRAFAHYSVLKKDVTVTVFWIYLVYFQNDQIWEKKN